MPVAEATGVAGPVDVVLIGETTDEPPKYPAELESAKFVESVETVGSVEIGCPLDAVTEGCVDALLTSVSCGASF